MSVVIEWIFLLKGIKAAIIVSATWEAFLDFNLGNNIVLVKECKASIKPKLTSNKPNAKAYFKVGVLVDITDIYVEKNNRIWGKLTNTWIVIQNMDGSPQAKIVNGWFSYL